MFRAAPQINPSNPLDKRNLGISVANELLIQPLQHLPPGSFTGAGIYAIYYFGSSQPFSPYARLAATSEDTDAAIPIYVGKAVPAGARKGGFGLGAAPGAVLSNRLSEHAASIEQAANLDVRDFACRYLLVEDIWIPLGEALLIERFKPLWNTTLDGFGNHDPGSGRHRQQRSLWDTLHPGRPWAERLLPHALSTALILERVEHSLRSLDRD